MPCSLRTRRYTPPTVLAERRRMAKSPYSRGRSPPFDDSRPGGDKRIYLPGDEPGLKSGLPGLFSSSLWQSEEHKLRFRNRRGVLAPQRRAAASS